jgi:Ser/Thr protein kinase RdoA (MazF antagonist)
MTTANEDTILHHAARTATLDKRNAHRLWQHATTIYLLPREQVIVRLRHGNDAVDAAQRAVAVARHLHSQGFPAPVPAQVDQPVTVDGYAVSFWRYYPQGEKPVPEPFHLGRLLRQLHQLPTPPIDLPMYRPLTSFMATVKASTSLPTDDQAWLLAEAGDLLDQYYRLDFPLGVGHIHGDAYPGNLLWDGDQVLLGDWDEVAIGPRELDLTNTHHGVRFGRTSEQLAAFTREYDYNVTDWTGYPVLRAIRDLHTLGTYIRLADRGDRKAERQLMARIQSLRLGDTAARWNSR